MQLQQFIGTFWPHEPASARVEYSRATDGHETPFEDRLFDGYGNEVLLDRTWTENMIMAEACAPAVHSSLREGAVERSKSEDPRSSGGSSCFLLRGRSVRGVTITSAPGCVHSMPSRALSNQLLVAALVITEGLAQA